MRNSINVGYNEIPLLGLPKETKIDLKHWVVREIGGKITVLDCGEEMSFVSNYQRVSKIKGLRTRMAAFHKYLVNYSPALHFTGQ